VEGRKRKEPVGHRGRSNLFTRWRL